MPNRYFEHVYNEISVAVGRRVSRYDLWLAMWSAGDDPQELDRKQLRNFLDTDLDDFLREEGVALDGRARRRLEKAVLVFNPEHPTPGEWFSRIVSKVRRSRQEAAHQE